MRGNTRELRLLSCGAKLMKYVAALRGRSPANNDGALVAPIVAVACARSRRNTHVWLLRVLGDAHPG